MSAALLWWWDDWFLNWDGGTYLALAESLVKGRGYVFPDGTPATFRGPIYPALLGLAWLIGPDTAKTAIWASRAVLVANAVLVYWIVLRANGRKIVAAGAAGAAAAAQPLPLISGGLFFAPDGLAAFFVLVAIALLLVNREVRFVRAVCAGASLGLAFVTKETALLALIIPIVILAIEPGFDGRSRGVRAVGGVFAGWVIVVAPWLLWAWVAAGTLPPPFIVLVGRAAWIPPGVVVVTMLLGWWAATVFRRGGITGLGERPWVGAVLVVGLLVTALGLLRLAGDPAARGWGEMWSAFTDDLDRQLYRDTKWYLVLVPAAVAVAWGMAARLRAGRAAALALLALGFAGIVDATARGAGLRNGVFAAYGLAMLAAFAFDAYWTSGHRGYRVLAAVLILSFVAGNLEAGYATNVRDDARQLTWDAPPVTAAAAWLADNAQGPIVGTPTFLTTLWVGSGASLDISLIPFFEAPGRLHEADSDDFDRRIWWAGHLPESPMAGDRPLTLTRARAATTSIFRRTLARYLQESNARYLVLSGNLAVPAARYDGGVLIPVLEETPSLSRVFASYQRGFSQWVVVYRVDGPVDFGDAPVIIYDPIQPSPAATPDEGDDSIDQTEYVALVSSYLLDFAGD